MSSDWTELKNGKHLITYEDDASRHAMCWGEFDEATTENSLIVLKEGIKMHGKPREMLTGRDSQFYTSEIEGKTQGRTAFQIFLEKQGIKHILARVNHPQTNGKLERFFGEVKKRIEPWNDFATVDEVVQWHNNIKPQHVA